MSYILIPRQFQVSVTACLFCDAFNAEPIDPVPGPTLELPWMTAWLEAERALSRIAMQAPLAGFAGFGRDQAGIAADLWKQLQSAEPDLDGLRAGLIERYRRLFMPVVAPAAAAGAVSPDAAFLRCQRAAERFGRHATEIAIDAYGRLSAELATDDPAAPPITTLRELHELWVECGEAAYAAAAHGEEFAEAQAELLASLVELRHGERLR